MGGFVAAGGLEQLSSGESDDGLNDTEEACPMCEGTGRTECSCTRWSDDGEGCASCGYTGVRICPACRGGGRAVRITLEIPVESEESPPANGGDRSGAVKRLAATTLAFAAPIAVPGPAGGVGGDALPARGDSTARRADQEALMRRLGQMPLRATDTVLVGASSRDGDGVVLRDFDVTNGTLGAIAEPPSNRSSGSGGPGGDNDKPENSDPSSSKDDDFYAQSGEAIRTLREDYPLLLEKPLVTKIYREDIGLVDETVEFGQVEGHVLASGLAEYKRCHKWLRTAARILFCQTEVNVLRIWSPLGSTGLRTIKVRWSIRGKLRLVGNMTEEAHFDGISEYKLDSGGFIYQHNLTDLDWDMAQMKERIAALQNGLVAQRTPELGSGQWFRNLIPDGWFR